MLNPLNSDLQAKLANYQNIPKELQQLRQWVNWHYEDIGALKSTKVPHGSVDKSETWITFNDAVNVIAHGKASGIGFVFTDNDPYCGIDLDEAKDDWLALERQQKIFKEFDSYSEKSVGGQGLHIIIKGKIPIGRKRSKIEIYSSKRYFTFTGNVYHNSVIQERQQLLSILFEQMGASIPKTMLFTGDKDETSNDKEIIEKAKSANNADKFIELLEGRWSNLYSSQSEADFAFIDIIAFYSRNKKQIARIFRNSPLGQRDKAKRDDYVEYMIHNSFDNMLPQIDIEGLNIEIEKLKGGVAQLVEPNAHNILVAGSSPVIPTNNAVSSNGRTTAFDAVNVGSNPATVAKIIDLPPGLLGEIANFIYAASPRPVPEIALAGAIGLMSGICGRAYNVSKTGLNQYILLLAPTGSGKEGISSGIGRIIEEVKKEVPAIVDFMGPSEIASGQALFKYMSKKSQSFVCILGEFGLRLLQMSNQNANSAEMGLRRKLLDLYNKSGLADVLYPSVYADSDKDLPSIQSPAFSICGESTPERFYENLNEDMISEGLLPRFLLIEYTGERVAFNEQHGDVKPSLSLTSKLVTIAANALTVNNTNPRRVITINLNNEAHKISKNYDEFCTRNINKADKDVTRHLWNRAHMKVLKLAGLVSIGINMYDPLITKEHIEWAINMVTNDIEILTKRFDTGNVGASTGEIAQIELLIKITKNYIMSDYEYIAKYIGKDERAKQLHHNKVIPYVFLSRKLLTYAPFKNDKRGATEALKRCLQVLCDRDSFREMSKHEMTNRFGSTQKAFVVSDVNVLK